jgi:F-type H+-transporting ATPase subunit b
MKMILNMTTLKNMTLRKILCGPVFGLLLLSWAAVVPVRAQDSASAPQQSTTAEPQVQKDKNRDKDSERHQGVGRQLAHESREAAGEEKDETAEFKQSASVRLISKWTGLDLQRAYWLSVLTNFVVIAVVIVWAARKYMPGLFRARTQAIQKAMQEAQKASEEARRRLAEIESRLAKLDAEIGGMRQAAEKEAAEEELRIRAATEEQAKKIIAAAEQEIAAAAKAARRELTAFAADLAVSIARKQIRVDAATDQALVRSFAGQLTATPDNPGKDRN